jgi:hypothetical protein
MHVVRLDKHRTHEGLYAQVWQHADNGLHVGKNFVVGWQPAFGHVHEIRVHLPQTVRQAPQAQQLVSDQQQDC